MVVKKCILFIFIFFCYFTSTAQNSFFDDIRLMDYQRNKQLLNDTNGVITNSFFIRSTSSYQFIQAKLKGTTKDIVQFINFNYDVSLSNRSIKIIRNDDNNFISEIIAINKLFDEFGIEIGYYTSFSIVQQIIGENK